MGNCSSGCATGLGVLQIVIGVWFVGLMIPRICECEDLVRVVRVVLASISALFISSGSVAIATAWKTTTGLMRASFVLSMLCSLVAFGLLILFAKVCHDVANHGWQWQELWYIYIMLVCLFMSLWPGCDEYRILIGRPWNFLWMNIWIYLHQTFDMKEYPNTYMGEISQGVQSLNLVSCFFVFLSTFFGKL